MSDTTEEDSTYGFAPKDDVPEAGELADTNPEAAIPEETDTPAVMPAVPSKSRARKKGMEIPPPPIPATPLETPVERMCQHCGFKYFGKIKARCPECSAPAETADDLLQFSDKRWVRRVATGMVLLAAGIGVNVVGSALSYMGFNDKGLNGDTSRLWQGTIAHIIASAILVIGTFIVTSKEPGRGHWKTGFLLVELVALLGLGAWIARALVLQQGDNNARTIEVVVMVATAAQGALAILLAYQLSGLAARVPNDQLISHSINSGGLVTVVCLTLIGIRFFDLYIFEYFRFFMCSFPLLSGLLVILAWAAFTCLRLAFELRSSAGAGEAIAQKRLERELARRRPPKSEGAGPTDLR